MYDVNLSYILVFIGRFQSFSTEKTQGDQREEAKTICLASRSTKKIHLSKRGQVVLLKDLHNIAASSKDSSRSGIEAIDQLKKVPGK